MTFCRTELLSTKKVAIWQEKRETENAVFYDFEGAGSCAASGRCVYVWRVQVVSDSIAL